MIEIMQGNEHEHALLPGKVLHEGQNLHLAIEIQSGRGLIHQENFRIADKRLGDGDELSLSSRELTQVAEGKVGDLQRAEQPVDVLQLMILHTPAAPLLRREQNGFVDRQHSVGIRVLRHVPDRLAFGRPCPVQHNGSGPLEQSGNPLEQG